MSKLERKHLKVFAKDASLDEVNQFGAIKVETKDIEEIQALEAWNDGWTKNIVGTNLFPTLQARNGVDYVLSYQTAYILQEGIPEWNNTTEYNVGSVVKVFDGTTARLYTSLQDNNIGNVVTRQEYWKLINPDVDYNKLIIDTLKLIYPVGATYMTSNNTCPMGALFGTWELVASGKALWTGNGSNGGETISAGLPNITGRFATSDRGHSYDGALYPIWGAENRGDNNGKTGYWIALDASLSNSIYGRSTTVQPPAYVVNVYRRVS